MQLPALFGAARRCSALFCNPEKRRKAPNGAETRRKLHDAAFGSIKMPNTVLDVRRWAVGSARKPSSRRIGIGASRSPRTS
eukprot:2689694-Alexandrium_andersonii.AAC.1